MDLDLKDLGATLVLGGYFLFGLDVLRYLFFGENWIQRLRLDSRITQTGAGAVTLALCFGSGMLLEDISNKFVDIDAGGMSIHLLPPESELRREALLGDDLPERVRSLGRDYAELGLFASIAGTDGQEVQEAIRSDRLHELLGFQKLTDDVVSQVYYHAKNTVYREPNYFSELRHIQTRIDFARSFTLLSVALAMAALVLGLAKVARPRLGNLPGREMAPRTSVRRLIVLRIVATQAVLALLIVGGRTAYAREETEFDLRAFGYFRTLHGSGVSGPLAPNPAGYSDVARLEVGGFVVVHDTKRGSLAPRLGWIEVPAEGAPSYRPLSPRWPKGEAVPNDLEAICALPGLENEVLVAESGPYDGVPGRIFHLAIGPAEEDWQVTVRTPFPLPSDAEQVEGMACASLSGGRFFVILGERGGDGQPARLVSGIVHLGGPAPPGFAPLGSRELPAPREGWFEGAEVRGCTALHLDDRLDLWAAASQDAGDQGPFRSVIYRVGAVGLAGEPSIETGPGSVVAWYLDALKVEGVTGPATDRAALSIVTDDEDHGGVWRALFPQGR